MLAGRGDSAPLGLGIGTSVHYVPLTAIHTGEIGTISVPGCSRWLRRPTEHAEYSPLHRNERFGPGRVIDALQRSCVMAKRVFDLVFSASLGCQLAPVLFMIALWVALDSPGRFFSDRSVWAARS